MALRQEALAANLGSPLKLFNFRVEIPNIPGGGNSEVLKLRCQSSVKPGFSVETIHLDYEGTPGLEYEGRVRVPQEITLTFIEGEDLAAYKTLKDWYNKIRDEGNARNRTSIYLYDVGEGRTDLDKTTLVYAFIKNLSDTPRSFDNGPVVLSATFAYSDIE